MNGILNINKPKDRTSFSIVAMVRQLSGEKRVGHAGTLDPAATGVLPVCLGQGTRVIEFLVATTKTYLAEIELGVATDTYDASGKITQRGDYSGIGREQLESVLTSYCGLIKQTPPMYSAVKYQGKPLYQLARAGIEVKRESRLTEIYDLKLTDWQPPLFTVEVVCGKGTYIRSLAHDLGQTLGCGANLKSLVRLRCGLFDIKNAISLPQLEDAFRYGYWQQFIHPIDIVLLHWSAMVVSDTTGIAIRNGCPLSSENHLKKAGYLEQQPPVSKSEENRCRVYNPDGCFLGVLRFNPEREQWQPEKLLL
jgi:tRNA pseudouridine55 synthase